MRPLLTLALTISIITASAPRTLGQDDSSAAGPPPTLWSVYFEGAKKSSAAGRYSESEQLLLSAIKQFGSAPTLENSYCQATLQSLLEVYKQQHRQVLADYIQLVLSGKRKFLLADIDLSGKCQGREQEADLAGTPESTHVYEELLNTETDFASKQRLSAKLGASYLNLGQTKKAQEVLEKSIVAYDGAKLEQKESPAVQARLNDCLRILAAVLKSQNKHALAKALEGEANKRQADLMGSNLLATNPEPPQPMVQASKSSEPTTGSNTSYGKTAPNWMLSALKDATQPVDLKASDTGAPNPIPLTADGAGPQPKRPVQNLASQSIPILVSPRPGAPLMPIAQTPRALPQRSSWVDPSPVSNSPVGPGKFRLALAGAIAAGRPRSLSDAELAKLEAYLQRIHSRFQNKILHTDLNGRGKGQIIFLINSKGALTGASVFQSSNNSELDKTLFGTITGLQPFEKLPSSLLCEEIGLVLLFER
ncbi:MAG: hypothetical protein U0105_07940 [Candidatus Obscuribacterales bacterium]